MTCWNESFCSTNESSWKREKLSDESIDRPLEVISKENLCSEKRTWSSIAKICTNSRSKWNLFLVLSTLLWTTVLCKFFSSAIYDFLSHSEKKIECENKNCFWKVPFMLSFRTFWKIFWSGKFSVNICWVNFYLQNKFFRNFRQR